MKKKYTGYIITVLIVLLYNLLRGNLNSGLLSIFSSVIGTLIIPSIITVLIALFAKSKVNFGTILSYVTAVVCGISLIGHYVS